MKKRVALISTHTSLYKLGIWPELANNKSFEIDFYCSSSAKWGIATFDIEEAKKVGMNLREIKNYYIRDKLLFFQRIPFFEVLFSERYDILILPGEVTCISTWMILFFSKLLRKKTIIWTHGMYGKETWFRKNMKSFFYKLSNELFVYGHHSKKLLIESGFTSNQVHVVYNSLNYKLQKKIRTKVLDTAKTVTTKKALFSNDYPVVLFLGRLTERKRLDLLVEAAKIIKSRKKNCNYLVIGEGNMNYVKDIKKTIYNYKLNDSFNFLGALYDESDLSNYISFIDSLVIPGKVGLSSMHSLAFGKPVISHSDISNQVPEFESIEIGKTGYLFEAGNAEDLADKILMLLERLKENPRYFYENCIRVIEEKYCPEIQNKIITKAILNL